MSAKETNARSPLPTKDIENQKPPTPTSTKDKEEHDDDASDNESKHSEESNEARVLNAEDLIDMNTFDQLLDMDDEDDHDFSYSIVLNYFEQAEATFDDMDAALDKKDLSELSRLGHFLKGSSAAIGLRKVKATCEKIQNIGNRQNEEGEKLEEAEALAKITPLLPQVKAEYSEAEEYLKNFYDVQEAR